MSQVAAPVGAEGLAAGDHRSRVTRTIFKIAVGSTIFWFLATLYWGTLGALHSRYMSWRYAEGEYWFGTLVGISAGGALSFLSAVVATIAASRQRRHLVAALIAVTVVATAASGLAALRIYENSNGCGSPATGDEVCGT